MSQRRAIELTNEERKALEERRDHDPRPDVRERCAAILKVGEGKSGHEVARQGLLKVRDPDTIYHWLDLYAGEGITGLVNHRHGGSRQRSVRGSGERA